MTDAEMIFIIEAELQKRNIEGYRQNMLHAHFWKQGHLISQSLMLSLWCLLVSLTYYSDWLYDMIKILNSDDVAQWRYDLQWSWGEYIVSGPNFLWSIDGYCKLDMFEFEIYRAVDAYSWYIVWIYVEVSAHISISCLQQFLNTVKNTDKISRIIRSDCRVKTGLLAAAHHCLHQSHESDILFKNCFFYRTSTKNQWIESWWNQLSKTLIYHWHVNYLFIH